MKRRILFFAMLMTAFVGRMDACIWYEAESDFHNLFSQDIMNDQRYRPFLLTLDSRYYPHEKIHNGNIEEWQYYLGLDYKNTSYLVFNSSRDDIMKLLKGKSASDKNLAFATPEFVKKHKQALLYLAYSKYLEPYMRIVPSEDSDNYWDFEDNYEHNAGDLDYNKVKSVLTKSWNAERDNELKLRYGYQLVRLAHYTRRYDEAIQLFDTYVKPLDMRTEMYYYALGHKAGALRGKGEMEKANREYVRVFANSTDLKTQAYTSMTLGWDNEISFADFIKGAENDNERNDIYLMMGYNDFSNPSNEIEKIIANTPDAIQAKVLMVRAINSIERTILNAYTDPKLITSKRYPDVDKEKAEKIKPFLNQTIAICQKQCNNAKDKNFWNLAASYLLFLNKDFDKASNAIGNVKSNDELYMIMVRNLNAYIDICRQPKITPEVEGRLFEKYHDLITAGSSEMYDEKYCFNYVYPTFIENVLTNRYALQNEKGKSYMVINHIRSIENKPQDKLIDDMLAFLNKKNKTSLEQYIAQKATQDVDDYNSYFAYVKGVLRLTDGNLKTAKAFFDKQTRLKVSKLIFGHNIRVWYSGEENEIMRDDYISEFPFIRDDMNEADVTDALMQLQKIGDKNNGDISAKACYLMANFYYNVSITGYFRHYLRFDDNNGFCYDKYSLEWETNYKNTLQLSTQWLNKAQKMAKDDELKARIAFAQSKNAQQVLECEGKSDLSSVSEPLFKEFMRYGNTSYYKDVMTTCSYFIDFKNAFDY